MNALFNCARLLATEGQYMQAVRVFGAIDGVGGNARQSSLFGSLTQRRLESAHSAVGPELVAAAWTEGRAMSLDAAVEYARQQLGESAG